MALIKRILSLLAQSNIFWWIIGPFSKVYEFMRAIRIARKRSASYKREFDFYNRIFDNIICGRVVLNGPFKGLVYPSNESFGSALYPKLIGSYEMELHPIVEKICLKHYTKVINIGCGEGYYAVGLARRLTLATVYAFDMSDTARELTARMAKENDVYDRVIISSICTSQFLKEISLAGKGLIVCDCEGCENVIFNASNINNLKNWDFLIETHDFININISTHLKKLFSATHSIRVVKSIDDIEKAKTYSFDEAVDFDLKYRKVLFGEGRPAIMEWFYMEPIAS